MESIRTPAVAGSFYPADPRTLQSQVAELLAAARPGVAGRPKAMIAPHAGYSYSGPTAASAYARLAPFRDQITRVVLLGPAHRVRLRGLALPSVHAFLTPLGPVPLDTQAMARIRDLPQVGTSDEAHAQEHSIEVHLPFLQSVLGDFRLVPLVVGEAAPAEVAEVIDRLWGGDETLVVVSSDLSHYLAYEQARAFDAGTTRRILGLDTGLDRQMACGATPVNGLLELVRRRGLAAQLVDQRNSGDTSGDRHRVVGYASYAFYAKGDADGRHEGPVPDSGFADGPLLLSLARAAISARFGLRFERDERQPALDRPAATFITLRKGGKLRGCIGSLAPHRNLREDIEANAVAAAFSDPRFEPLRFEELRDIVIEVSLLSPMEPMQFGSEADLLAQLKPGEDGLVLQYGQQRGTFLPQVWESLPDPAAFLNELKRKAGLPSEFWHPDLRVSRYRVTKLEEPERA